jgi:hypothetical protein
VTSKTVLRVYVMASTMKDDCHEHREQQMQLSLIERDHGVKVACIQ